MKAGETNNLKTISAEVVNGIAGRFLRTYKKQRTRQPAMDIPDTDELPPVQELPMKDQPKEKAEPKVDERTAAEKKEPSPATPATPATAVPTPVPVKKRTCPNA